MSNNKKWYEYLLTVKEDSDSGSGNHAGIAEDDSENQFVAVPAPPPGKSAVVAAAVAEALSRSTTAPPPPSALPIMTPANRTHENVMEMPKPQPAFVPQIDLQLPSVDMIYDEANFGDETVHGYSALKVVNMLKSEHLRNMPMEAKRSSLLLALEASGTKLQDVVDDALRRIRLLQQQERDTARNLEALERRKAEENQKIGEDLAMIVQEHNRRIQSNTEHVARMKAQFLSWRVQVKEEEQKVAEVLSYFTGQSMAVKEQGESGKGEKS